MTSKQDSNLRGDDHHVHQNPEELHLTAKVSSSTECTVLTFSSLVSKFDA